MASRTYLNRSEYARAWREYREHVATIRRECERRAAEWKRDDGLCSSCGHRIIEAKGARRCGWDPTHAQ